MLRGRVARWRPRSGEHRRWRAKVFAATWFSYVGLLLPQPFSAAKSAIGDEMGWGATALGDIYVAYLVAYVVGQFLASAGGTRMGPRRTLLLGMAVSIAVTAAMGVAMSSEVMMGLVAVNGLAQARRANVYATMFDLMGDRRRPPGAGHLAHVRREPGVLGPIFVLLFGSAALATLFYAALVWRNRRGGHGV